MKFKKSIIEFIAYSKIATFLESSGILASRSSISQILSNLKQFLTHLTPFFKAQRKDLLSSTYLTYEKQSILLLLRREIQRLSKHFIVRDATQVVMANPECNYLEG